MANNFKNDDSFLRKLAVGTAGTNATIKWLKDKESGLIFKVDPGKWTRGLDRMPRSE